MSYFPPHHTASPYTPPLDGGPDWSIPYLPPDALRSAKRAALWMFVLSVMSLLAGGLFFIVSTIPLDRFPPETRRQMEQIVDPSSGLSIQTSLIATGVVMCLPGVVMGILGFFVRAGRLWAMTVSMVLDGGLIAITGLAAISSFFNSIAGGVMASAPFLLAGTTMVLMMTHLITARRAAKAAKILAAQYQWQYWQMGSGDGWGYGNQK